MTEDQFKALSKQLDSFLIPIKTIAIVQLVRELYPQAEREKLVAEYDALAAADRKAFDAVEQAYKELSPSNITFEERVKQFGKKEADRHLAPVMDATERRKDASAALDAFRKHHRLIARMVDNKDSLGKARYEE
jgi:hypothetical protein